MNQAALVKRKQQQTIAGMTRALREPLRLDRTPAKSGDDRFRDITLLVCMSGTLRLGQSTGTSYLPAGMSEVVDGAWLIETMPDTDPPMWLSVSGSAESWREALASRMHFKQRTLLPGRTRLRAEDGAALIETMIANADESIALKSVFDRILPLQDALHDQVDRCPGRTLEQRRRVFWRLQRVRNYLRANCGMDLGIQAGAEHSGYSPCHFLRVFHRVFGETPQSYVTRQRLVIARELLRSSPFGVNEVGVAAGFESRSSFSRQFRRHYGISASAFRRGSGKRKVPTALVFDPCTRTRNF